MKLTEEELTQLLQDNPDLKLASSPGGSSKGKKKRHKYRVADKAERVYDGVTYHSKKERDAAQLLDIRQAAGEIDFWLRQVPFPLPGKTKYVLDFITFKRRTGALAGLYQVEYIEVKGYRIRLGEIKRRQAEEIYGIKVIVI